MKTVQPRKQHKMLYKAPLHIRYKHFSAALSESLKTTHKINSMPVRTGDTVRIMRGDQKGSEGKVTKVDRKKYRILVDGITRQKVDGSSIQIPLHPSKVMITNLNLDDKWRRDGLKIEAEKEPERAVAEKKPEAKKERKKRKPRRTTAQKRKTARKTKTQTSKIKKKGEITSG